MRLFVGQRVTLGQLRNDCPLKTVAVSGLWRFIVKSRGALWRTDIDDGQQTNGFERRDWNDDYTVTIEALPPLVDMHKHQAACRAVFQFLNNSQANQANQNKQEGDK